VARVTKGAADNFQDRAPEFANADRKVADWAEGVYNDICDRSVNELMRSVADFAAEKPLALFGVGIYKQSWSARNNCCV
jgi:hypothetical protein